MIRYPIPVWSRFYGDIARKDEKILASYLGIEVREANKYYEDLYKESSFFRNLASCQEMLEQPIVRGGLMDKREAAIIYGVTRHLKVDRSVETGVGSGLSTSHILLALHHNQKGHLFSVDLPNTDAWTGAPRQMLPAGKLPGWVVPEYLKPRWTLLPGNARIQLPELIKQLPDEIDLFLHDSLHTYEHMMWEFETLWPHLRSRGILMADDADSNRAVQDFSKRVGRVPLLIYGLGILQKG